jgi:hypothetical protein
MSKKHKKQRHQDHGRTKSVMNPTAARCRYQDQNAESLIDSYEILAANGTAGESLPCRGGIQMRRRRNKSVTMPRPKKASVEGSGTGVILISPNTAVPLFALLGFPLVWIWK